MHADPVSATHGSSSSHGSPESFGCYSHGDLSGEDGCTALTIATAMQETVPPFYAKIYTRRSRDGISVCKARYFRIVVSVSCTSRACVRSVLIRRPCKA